MGTDVFDNYTVSGQSAWNISNNGNGTYSAAITVGGGPITLNGTVSTGSTSIQITNGFQSLTEQTYTGTAIGDGSNYIIVYVPAENAYFLSSSSPVTHNQVFTPDASFGNFHPACYLSGSLIETAAGEIPVESLARHDLVLTAAGALRPIKWIGKRAYAGRILAANPQLMPIRFTAGCLGSGLPRRDLLVSPKHAMFVDGFLVPAELLVNGSTIARETVARDLEYYHIELDTHDIILAEGAASETFLDDDSRGTFQNAGEFATLYPDAPASGEFCAPRLQTGPQLDAIRRNLDGVGIYEIHLDRDGLHRAMIPDGSRAVRLITRPCHAPGDSRFLGAAISNVIVDGEDFDLGDARLATGWHSREGTWRWTDGAALVLTPGGTEIEVMVAALAVAAAA